jgi:hypothetical protein
MNVIGIYNADAERLQTALDAMEDSEFTWYVRGYALEMAMDLGHWDRNPTDADLPLLQIRAKTKARYAGQRLTALIYIGRELAEADRLQVTCGMLEMSVQELVEDTLQEQA